MQKDFLETLVVGDVQFRKGIALCLQALQIGVFGDVERCQEVVAAEKLNVKIGVSAEVEARYGVVFYMELTEIGCF